MTEADKLVSIAMSQIGVTEDPKGSNNVPYNTAYYGREVSGNGYPWCMAFVWWCFRQAGLSALFYGGKQTASCTTLMKWAANRGQFVAKNYKRGDVFLYDYDGVKSDSEHTGIFTGEMSGERYQAVEGNYNDAVCVVYRKPSDIIGAFRPTWGQEDGSDSGGQDYPLKVGLPELSQGSFGGPVRAMQILLEGRGYSVGRYGCDGEFGNDTASALKSYQKSMGLDADAICGIRTWSSLLEV